MSPCHDDNFNWVRNGLQEQITPTPGDKIGILWQSETHKHGCIIFFCSLQIGQGYFGSQNSKVLVCRILHTNTLEFWLLYASIISTISSQFTVHELPYVQMVEVKLHNMKHHAMQNIEAGAAGPYTGTAGWCGPLCSRRSSWGGPGPHPPAPDGTSVGCLVSVSARTWSDCLSVGRWAQPISTQGRCFVKHTFPWLEQKRKSGDRIKGM